MGRLGVMGLGEGQWGEEDLNEGREGEGPDICIISWCIVNFACLFSNIGTIWNNCMKSYNFTYGGGADGCDGERELWFEASVIPLNIHIL